MASDHPQHPSTQRVQSVIVTPRDGAPPLLFVEIDVNCQVCGGFTAVIAGHHIKALTQALSEVVEANPGLVGPEMTEERVTRTQWAGQAPGKGKERLN